MAGRDEDFQRLIRDGLKQQPVPVAPQRTLTEITLQSNKLALVKLTDDEGETTGYEMRFMDPYFNRIIIFPMSTQNAIDFYADFGEFMAGSDDQ